jgi:hypothetical protein
LKGVDDQQHQVEASVQPGRCGVIEHSGYARAPAPLFRLNGRSRSFHRSHAHRCWLVAWAGTPHQVIIGGNIGRNQASHLPSGLTAKWATYKSSKMRAQRRTRHCGGRRGRGQRLCEMVARSVGLCAAGSRWRGRRASASLGRASRRSSRSSLDWPDTSRSARASETVFLPHFGHSRGRRARVASLRVGRADEGGSSP